jgi:hypothetical protein
MNVPYTCYEIEPTPSQPGVTEIYRPVIPFRVIGPAAAAVFYGLLDSGADETMLPQALADLVGIVLDPSQTGTALTASGEMAVTYADVTFEIGQGRGKRRWRATVHRGPTVARGRSRAYWLSPIFRCQLSGREANCAGASKFGAVAKLTPISHQPKE